MKGMENSLEPAQLLRRTSWLKALAGSLVRDQDRAEDVVQETWLAYLRRPPRHAGATDSWLRSVARKLAYRSYRAESRRRRHEELAASPEVSVTPEDTIERFDLQRQLVELVAGLREPYRSTILLRFFEEMRPRDIARRQGVGVTTVRWRLQKALEVLRARLDQAHGGSRTAWQASFVSLAGLPGLNGSTASPLLAATAGSSPLASAGPALPSLALGGILMAKKLTFFWGLAVLLSLATGWGVWQAAKRGTGNSVEGPDLTRERDELSLHLKRLELELRQTKSERDLLAQAKGRLEEELQGLRAPGPPAAEGSEANEAGSLAAGSSLRWREFRTVLARSLEILAKVERHEPLSEEEEAKLAHLWAEVQKISAEAKSLNRYPFFDWQIFDELTLALFQDPLHLSEEQLARFGKLKEGLFAGLPEDIDTLSPLKRFRLREEMTARLWKGLEEILDEEQMDTWPALKRYSEQLFNYGSRFELGVSGAPRAFLGNWIRNAMKENPEPALLDTLTPFAENFLREGSDLLDRFLPAGGDLKSLSPQARADLDQEMLRLQERFQKEVEPLLSDNQRQLLHDRPPMVIRFMRGNGTGISVPLSPF